MTKTRRACRLVFSLAWAWRPGAPQAFRQSFPVHGGLKVHSKLCGLACRLMRDLWPTRVLASCAVPFDVESLSPCRGVHTFMPTCFALHSCHVSVRLHACAWIASCASWGRRRPRQASAQYRGRCEELFPRLPVPSIAPGCCHST